MSELKPLLLGSMFALLVVSAALAQVTIDVSKITCDQYVLDQVTDFRTITASLSGIGLNMGSSLARLILGHSIRGEMTSVQRQDLVHKAC